MDLPIGIVIALFTAGLAVQGWTLKTISELKVKVAVLESTVRGYHSDTQQFIRSKP